MKLLNVMHYARQSNVKNLRRQNFSSCFFVREINFSIFVASNPSTDLAMNRKLKLALAALLGFSAACSTIKKAPTKGNSDNAAVSTDTVSVVRPVVVMYGVRPPKAQTGQRTVSSVSPQDSTMNAAPETNKPEE